MTTPIYLNAIYRDSAWWVNTETPPLILTEGKPVSVDCAFPTNGVSRQKPEVLMDYQYDLASEAEQILRAMLAVMTDYHQVKMLSHFLLGVCDTLEFSIYKTLNKVEDCQFEIRFSNSVCLEFSTKAHGITLWWQQKPRTVHMVDAEAIRAFREIANEAWSAIQDLPIWEIVSDTKRLAVYRRRALK